MGEFTSVGLHREVTPESALAKGRSAVLKMLRKSMLSITERMTFFSSGSGREAASDCSWRG